MYLQTELYADQAARWPKEGRHILAHYDDETIVVYQAYRPSIGRHAIEHGRFGGEYSYSRMSWIKPNFLWMMYRSGWATKDGQEVVLGLRLRRAFFDEILSGAVASSLGQSHFESKAEWKRALGRSHVRLQWDPDHTPTGHALPRRAIQLGLRGPVLEEFGQRALLDVIDMTGFVADQRVILKRIGKDGVRTPVEQVYRPDDPDIAARLKLD